MRKLTTLLIGIVMASATSAFAADGWLSRPLTLRGPALYGPVVFFGQDAPPPAPAEEGAVPATEPIPMSDDVELFECVKYKDLDEMAPCAVPMVVQVKDPCHTCDPCDCCCKPKCVNVKICVPKCVPCGHPVIKCNKDGTRVRYDFGKYAVDVRVKKGYIEVDYQD